MPIVVVCPGCRARFQVSDRFAGQSGACPKCKATIRVPTAAEEVKVHTPEAFEGSRGVSGKLVLKPIARTQVRFEPVVAVGIAAGALVVLVATWILGRAAFWDHALVRTIGLLLVSPPLVLGAYTFLYDDELEPYRGKALYLRTAICAAGYVLLWGVFGYFVAPGMGSGELYHWFYVAPLFSVMGTLIALATLDLEFGSAFFHYAFYLLVTIILRGIGGMGWIWQLNG